MSSTKEQIIALASQLIQQKGFHGFSFQNLADAVGIKKASLYAHFKSKEDLGNQLLSQAQEELLRMRKRIAERPPLTQLDRMIDVYASFAKADYSNCPIVMLSAEWHTLPESMRKQLEMMTAGQISWIEDKITEAKALALISAEIDIRLAARSLFTMALGTQSLARIQQDMSLFQTAKQQIRHILEVRA